MGSHPGVVQPALLLQPQDVRHAVVPPGRRGDMQGDKNTKTNEKRVVVDRIYIYAGPYNVRKYGSVVGFLWVRSFPRVFMSTHGKGSSVANRIIVSAVPLNDIESTIAVKPARLVA